MVHDRAQMVMARPSGPVRGVRFRRTQKLRTVNEFQYHIMRQPHGGSVHASVHTK